MRELTGDDGELVGRLVEVADSDRPDDPHWWLDVSGVIARAIGGCDHLAPHSDRRSADGTTYWEHEGGREVVARITWMNHLRLRLAALVESGVAEDFLVVALRDAVERELGPLRSGSTGAPAPAVDPPAPPRTRYDEWIAEQATGDNLELSLVARALMGTDAAIDLTAGADAGAAPSFADGSGGDPAATWTAAWAAASASISDAETARWRERRDARLRA